MRWREGVFYNYEGYFGKRRNSTEDEKPSFGPHFNVKKWQWMLMVDKLVKEHGKTPEQIYKTNYIDCLNWLSLYREKDKYLEGLQKQMNKK